jgi:hypothetical protein
MRQLRRGIDTSQPPENLRAKIYAEDVTSLRLGRQTLQHKHGNIKFNSLPDPKLLGLLCPYIPEVFCKK